VISTACPDWERRVVAGETLIASPPLFPGEASAALDVFRQLRLVDVAGSPTVGESCRPWVFDFVGSVFGAYDPDSGRRAIREWLLMVSKKNSKSTIAAGIMLTALLLNWRQSGEFGILAPTLEVANNAYRPLRDMIRADDELTALLHVQDHLRTITHRTTHATLQVVAADSETVAGKKWIGTLVDELWLFGKKPNADRMLLEATGGMASRPEGFTIYLSTHSDEPPAGVFRDKLQYARGVRDGRIVDPEFQPVLYEWPQAMIDSQAYTDRANWHITNPNLGASVDPEFIAKKLREAGEGGKESLQLVYAKHLNVEIGQALRADRWAGADFWAACSDKTLTLESLLSRCDVVEVGIDGGGLDDLFGLCVLGRESASGLWLAWSKAWAHPIVLERRKSESARLMDFVKDGDLVLVQSIGQDVEEACAIVSQINDTGLLDKIGVDPAGLGGVLDALDEIGIEQSRVVGISQGWRMAGSIKTVERKLAAKEVRHGGAPLMAWSVGNARIEPRANAVMITKQVSGAAKIDPLMALLNAAELLARAPSGARSFWEIQEAAA
jgi:phage terminase large subunit-like protein